MRRPLTAHPRRGVFATIDAAGWSGKRRNRPLDVCSHRLPTSAERTGRRPRAPQSVAGVPLPTQAPLARPAATDATRRPARHAVPACPRRSPIELHSDPSVPFRWPRQLNHKRTIGNDFFAKNLFAGPMVRSGAEKSCPSRSRRRSPNAHPSTAAQARRQVWRGLRRPDGPQGPSRRRRSRSSNSAILRSPASARARSAFASARAWS